jgi:hypothetical protein
MANAQRKPLADYASPRRRNSAQQRAYEDEPMTGVQASYLKALCDDADEPQAYDENLSKSEASKRIDDLKDKLGLLDPPPHTD